VFAITHASQKTLNACGGVSDDIMKTNRVSAFDRMQVWDALGKGHITFDAADLAEENDDSSIASLFGPSKEDDRRAAEIINKTQQAVSEISSRAALAASSVIAAAGVVAGKDLTGFLPSPLKEHLSSEKSGIGRDHGFRDTHLPSQSNDAASSFKESRPLGFIAENDVLNGALFDQLQRLHASGQIDLVCPAKVTKIQVPPLGKALQVLPEARGESGGDSSSNATRAINPDALASITLDNGRTIKARLVVGADGAMSAVRAAANIGTWGWSYDQTAVVATVRTNRAHGTAWQRFLPHGPLAVLPVSSTIEP
jgi:hypothetical protein